MYKDPKSATLFFKKHNKERYPALKVYYADKALKRLYGISWEDKVQMYAKQNGLCPICEQPLPEVSKACTDHDHETGRVRGLVHKRCNLDVAAIEKHLKRLDIILAYLKDNDNGESTDQ